MNTDILRDQGQIFWAEGDYLQAIEYFEEAIQSEPQELSNYWNLGLAYLLQGEEETAQLVWLSAIAEQGEEETDTVIQGLVQILSAEAKRLSDLEQFREAWVIRNHVREFEPQNLTNLCLLIELSINIDEFTIESLQSLGIIELIQVEESEVELSVLTSVLKKILEYPAEETLHFAEACLSKFSNQEDWAELLSKAAGRFAFELKLTIFAIALTKVCLQYAPNNLASLAHLPQFYNDCKNYPQAIIAAQDFYDRSTSDTKFFANCILLQTFMKRGNWQEIPVVADRFSAMVSEFILNQPTNLTLDLIRFLIVNTGVFLYLKDDIQKNRRIQNQAGQLFLKNIKANSPNAVKPVTINSRASGERLKVGYIAGTLRQHSVGWLSRWLFQHHDHKSFEIFTYLVNQRPEDPFFGTWFSNQSDQFRFLNSDIGKAVKTIRDDNLDILIDLDSCTSDQTSTIMALRPAPIQATWLGYDASGLPTIDYFIADPYVLANDAQQHYCEKIWRLPSTYIAVDGFELGVPTLRRSDLGIPENTVVYLSCQTALKRNPDIVRLQMKIIKNVPDSYFLVKGAGDQETIRNFFIQIALEEGVSESFLRFLPNDENEYIHRSNLQLADVVLDTYPYNGATTTLEVLWAGVPLVTRVGQQFSARNSYAFLMNVGVTEGIAWTDEEYIEWGVRFGQEEALRQKVAWKLKQSRHNSPLWNAKKFTREMEDAYQQMWAILQENQTQPENQ